MQSKISARASRRATRSLSSTSVVIGLLSGLCRRSHDRSARSAGCLSGTNIRVPTFTRQCAPDEYDLEAEACASVAPAERLAPAHQRGSAHVLADTEPHVQYVLS